MQKRHLIFFLVLFWLTGCAPAVGPVVSTLTTSQSVVEEGGSVVVTLGYRNNDGSQPYSNVVLTLNYASQLSLNSADQSPASCGGNCLEWRLGDLAVGAAGTFQVYFQVVSYIEPNIYELPIWASISGLNAGLTPAPASGVLYSNDSNGGSYSKSLSLYIAGRPTPTYPPDATAQPAGPGAPSGGGGGPAPVATPESFLNGNTVQIIVAVITGCFGVLVALIGGFFALRAARASKDK
jgi:hypothetical protein